MQTVFFSLGETVNPQQMESVLASIRHWPEVDSADRLRPKAAEGTRTSRMYYAKVKEGNSPADLCAKLRALPEVEYAEQPADRHMQDQ